MISATRLATVKALLLARVTHKIDHSEKPEIQIFEIYQIFIETILTIIVFTSSRKKTYFTQGAIQALNSRSDDGGVKD